MGDLTILIVNWNVRDLLRACLTSIYADLATSDVEAAVWVVDNASQDNSPAMVRTEFPGVHLLVSKENLGFAGGNNLALRQMDVADPPRYVFLLNPDTELCTGSLRTLIDSLETRPEVGLVGARLLFGDGSFQHSAFGFPGLWQILFDLFPLPGRLYETRLNGRYPRSRYEQGAPFPVDHPLGATMMVRWETVRQVGLLDQDFHMYCEEIDWCMRIKRAGWGILCVPQAKVIHHVGQSTTQIREQSFVNLWHSRHRLYNKHYGPLKRWLAKRLVWAGMRRKVRSARKMEQQGDLDQTEAASNIRAYEGALAAFE